jgi:hypothetical protein
MLKVISLKEFDGHGARVSMEFIWHELKHVDNNYDIQLFENDKIVKLDVPFSEVYHQCSDEEWAKLLEYIKEYLT